MYENFRHVHLRSLLRTRAISSCIFSKFQISVSGDYRRKSFLLALCRPEYQKTFADSDRARVLEADVAGVGKRTSYQTVYTLIRILQEYSRTVTPFCRNVRIGSHILGL